MPRWARRRQTTERLAASAGLGEPHTRVRVAPVAVGVLGEILLVVVGAVVTVGAVGQLLEGSGIAREARGERGSARAVDDPVVAKSAQEVVEPGATRHHVSTIAAAEVVASTVAA